MSTPQSQLTLEKAKTDLTLDLTPEQLQSLVSLDNFKMAPIFDAQAQSAFMRPNDRLTNALDNSKAHGLPPISVLPMAGQYLSLLTQFVGAKSVLEIGTLGGYSSIIFAQAGAKVTTIEIDAKHRDVALQNVEGLDVDIIHGAALDVMPKLYEEGRKFDMVFIDGDWDSLEAEFDWAVKLTRVGGCVFLDDVVPSMMMNGQVKEGGGENVITKVGRDERVQAALMPTVATHPSIGQPVFTGFILAIVKGH